MDFKLLQPHTEKSRNKMRHISRRHSRTPSTMLPILVKSSSLDQASNLHGSLK